jgi:hypothetical protein
MDGYRTVDIFAGKNGSKVIVRTFKIIAFIGFYSPIYSKILHIPISPFFPASSISSPRPLPPQHHPPSHYLSLAQQT